VKEPYSWNSDSESMAQETLEIFRNKRIKAAKIEEDMMAEFGGFLWRHPDSRGDSANQRGRVSIDSGL
jgi:hypothetical protein